MEFKLNKKLEEWMLLKFLDIFYNINDVLILAM
jgi:hypothetical protein